MNQLLEHKNKAVTALEDSYASIVGSFLMEPELKTLKVTITPKVEEEDAFNYTDDIIINGEEPITMEDLEEEIEAMHDIRLPLTVKAIIEDLEFLYGGEFEAITLELNREQFLTL